MTPSLSGPNGVENGRKAALCTIKQYSCRHQDERHVRSLREKRRSKALRHDTR